MTTRDCLFCKMASGEVQVDILYRDGHLFVIRDIRPRAPTHLLLIPLQHVVGLDSISEGLTSTMGQLFVVAEEMARREGVTSSGYRLVLNQGLDSGQEIPHLHMHLLGGKRLGVLG